MRATAFPQPENHSLPHFRDCLSCWNSKGIWKPAAANANVWETRLNGASYGEIASRNQETGLIARENCGFDLEQMPGFGSLTDECTEFFYRCVAYHDGLQPGPGFFWDTFHGGAAGSEEPCFPQSPCVDFRLTSPWDIPT